MLFRSVGCLPALNAQPKVPQGTRALLAQEIRNFRAGHYTLSIQACGGGSSRQIFEEFFLKHFTCRLVYYRHTEATKNPLKWQEAASAPFRPEFADVAEKYQKVELAHLFDSRTPNVNFAVGLGFGVAVVVEKTSAGVLELPAGTRAFIRIDDVQLVFNPRLRNDDVQV